MAIERPVRSSQPFEDGERVLSSYGATDLGNESFGIDQRLERACQKKISAILFFILETAGSSAVAILMRRGSRPL